MVHLNTVTVVVPI
jgi:hypothetical protein